MKKITLAIVTTLSVTATQDAEALWGRSEERENRGFSCETVCTKKACDKDPTVRNAAREKCIKPENGCARREKKPMGKYKIQDYMDDNGNTNWEQFFSDACSKTPTNLATSKPKPQATTPASSNTPVEPANSTVTAPIAEVNPLPKTPEASIPTAPPAPPAPEASIPTAPPAPPAPEAPLHTTPSSPTNTSPSLSSDLQSQIKAGVNLKKSDEIIRDQNSPSKPKDDLTNTLQNSPVFKSLEAQRLQEEKEQTGKDAVEDDEWK